MSKKSDMGLMQDLSERGQLLAIVLHKGTPTEAKENPGKFELGRMDCPEMGDFTDEMQERLFSYGLAKLLMDRASQVDMGREKLVDMRLTLDALLAGEWKREAKRGPSMVPVWVEAVARVKGVAVAQIQASLKGYSDEQKAAIKANSKVAEAIKAIEEERKAAESVSLDDLT